MKSLMLAPLLVFFLALLTAVGSIAADETTGRHSASLSLGYRFTDGQDQPSQAAEYLKLEDSVVGTAKLRSFNQKRHFYLDANYLNEADYDGELRFDQAGLLRLDIIGDSVHHNLNHIPYPSPVEQITNPVGGSNDLYREDQDPGAVYHVDVHQSSVHARAKLPSYPAHINLDYWRLDRRGHKQLRYLDESCTGCHQQSRSIDVNRITQQFTGSVDAHLGPVDLIFEQLLRVFRDQTPLTVDEFLPHNSRNDTAPASLVHDENPDSRLISSTIKAHTALSGGLDGAAAVTFGNRTNQSKITSLGPVEAKTRFVKTSGDVTYVPAASLTFNFRYRLLDMNSSNTNILNLSDVYNSTNPTGLSFPVKEAMDLTTAVYNATGSWRPSRLVTFKGDFRREDIDRGNTGTMDDEGAWLLPKTETRNNFRLSAYLRPTRELKINTWYQYKFSVDPAYATSVARGHQGFLALTWTPSAYWGLSANGRVALSRNNDTSIFRDDASSYVQYPIHRHAEDDNFSAGLWFTPVSTVHCNLNYGYIRNRTVQDIVFGSDVANGMVVEDNDVEYTQHVQTGVFNVDWQIDKAVRLSGEGHVAWSKARFDPQFMQDVLYSGITYTISSTDLKGFSALDTRQLGLTAGIDWTLVDRWTCSARYGFDKYEDRLGNDFDGTAQTVTVSLAKAW